MHFSKFCVAITDEATSYRGQPECKTFLGLRHQPGLTYPLLYHC